MGTRRPVDPGKVDPVKCGTVFDDARPSGSEIGLEHRNDGGFGLAALDGLHHLAADDHLQRRQAHHTLTGCQRGVRVGVDFTELDRAVLVAQLIDDRPQLLARRAPVSPVVYEDRTA